VIFLEKNYMKKLLLIVFIFSIAFTIQAQSVVDSSEIFTTVEVEATFPGGAAGWRKYLEGNLSPDVAGNNKAKPGTYKTIVQFVVDIDGTISDIKPLTSFGYGMEKEVKRVIKKGPKWVPAMQNGKVVKAYRIQPITFVVP
jgi:periplasmic protein TonB